MNVQTPTVRLAHDDRQLRALSLLVGGAIGLLFMLLVLGPMQAAIRLEEDRIQRLHGVRNSTEAVEAQQLKLTAQLHELRERAKSATHRIPTQAREDEFLTLLSHTARKTGVDVQDFRPLGILQNSDHDQMQVRLTGQADYSAVCRFLDALRAAPRMNRVTLMELSVVDAQRRQCSIDMTLDIFFNNRRGDKPKVAAAGPTTGR